MANNTEDVEKSFIELLDDVTVTAIEFGQSDYTGAVRTEAERRRANAEIEDLKLNLTIKHINLIQQEANRRVAEVLDRLHSKGERGGQAVPMLAIKSERKKLEGEK